IILVRTLFVLSAQIGAVQERGTLIYGETLDSFPAQIYDPMMESENGFAIDLMNQLAWEMDTTIEFQPVIWADSFTLLENGTVDMIQISYSEERAEKYYLSAPIYRSKGVVFFAR
ncbi:transporter substrate-binding domain-containing protein, partial [Anaerotignum lactatifermentans]|uniref:transporter substrate-binding domain-containing protein n=1 Tax=Anaerotignum lactatifermentans TaxID=160404 RepID=UPI00248DEEE0